MGAKKRKCISGSGKCSWNGMWWCWCWK